MTPQEHALELMDQARQIIVISFVDSEAKTKALQYLADSVQYVNLL